MRAAPEIRGLRYVGESHPLRRNGDRQPIALGQQVVRSPVPRRTSRG